MSNAVRDLIAWQKAMELVESVYRATENFPRHEIYGLTSQMRQAAVSVASNIAEGQGRNSKGEFVQFLGNARGSLTELETQLEISKRLGLIELGKWASMQKQVREVTRLINGLMLSLKGRSASASSK